MSAAVCIGRGSRIDSAVDFSPLEQVQRMTSMHGCWGVRKEFRDPWRRAALGAIPNHCAGTSPRIRGRHACSSVYDLPLLDSSRPLGGRGGVARCVFRQIRFPILGTAMWNAYDLISSRHQRPNKRYQRLAGFVDG
jgi:hypothetical protein